jgi:hypothetical protein
MVATPMIKWSILRFLVSEYATGTQRGHRTKEPLVIKSTNLANSIFWDPKPLPPAPPPHHCHSRPVVQVLLASGKFWEALHHPTPPPHCLTASVNIELSLMCIELKDGLTGRPRHFCRIDKPPFNVLFNSFPKLLRIYRLNIVYLHASGKAGRSPWKEKE